MKWELQLASTFLFLLEKFTLNVLFPLLSVLWNGVITCQVPWYIVIWWFSQLGLFTHHVSFPSIWTHIVVIMLALHYSLRKSEYGVAPFSPRTIFWPFVLSSQLLHYNSEVFMLYEEGHSSKLSGPQMKTAPTWYTAGCWFCSDIICSNMEWVQA